MSERLCDCGCGREAVYILTAKGPLDIGPAFSGACDDKYEAAVEWAHREIGHRQDDGRETT